MSRRKKAPVLRLPGVDDDLVPAARSMYQTSLHHKEKFSLPQMGALEVVETALKKDAMSQNLKYDAGVPSCGSARFCVNLPRSPQHEKYCNRLQYSNNDASETAPGSPRDGVAPPPKERGPKPECLKELGFNKHSLHMLFREIDSKATGFVTHRGVMHALNERLKDMLKNPKTLPEATGWLRELAKEVDVEKTSSMNWKRFLEFFRRAGLFLEYQEEKDIQEAQDNGGLGALNVLQQMQQEVRSHVMADVTEGHSTMQSEIRLSQGMSSEARFNKNRRAGSPADAPASP